MQQQDKKNGPTLSKQIFTQPCKLHSVHSFLQLSLFCITVTFPHLADALYPERPTMECIARGPNHGIVVVMGFEHIIF